MLLRKKAFRLSVLALALAVTALALKGPAPAAAGNVIIECDYYSDASHATLVGSYTRVCNGHTSTWGTVTQYSVCITEPCGV